MRLFTRLTGILLLLVNVTATAETATATASSLDDLLQKVKLQQQQNQHQNDVRNEDFSQDLELRPEEGVQPPQESSEPNS